jgi:hypothetical protein
LGVEVDGGWPGGRLAEAAVDLAPGMDSTGRAGAPLSASAPSPPGLPFGTGASVALTCLQVRVVAHPRGGEPFLSPVIR